MSLHPHPKSECRKPLKRQPQRGLLNLLPEVWLHHPCGNLDPHQTQMLKFLALIADQMEDAEALPKLITLSVCMVTGTTLLDSVAVPMDTPPSSPLSVQIRENMLQIGQSRGWGSERHCLGQHKVCPFLNDTSRMYPM